MRPTNSSIKEFFRAAVELVEHLISNIAQEFGQKKTEKEFKQNENPNTNSGSVDEPDNWCRVFCTHQAPVQCENRFVAVFSGN